ncbi:MULTISPECIES: hypothetical protein [unclassified Moorena]|nr:MULTISPECIES: hypothetical protein [unclassified Moorena]
MAYGLRYANVHRIQPANFQPANFQPVNFQPVNLPYTERQGQTTC